MRAPGETRHDPREAGRGSWGPPLPSWDYYRGSMPQRSALAIPLVADLGLAHLGQSLDGIDDHQQAGPVAVVHRRSMTATADHGERLPGRIEFGPRPGACPVAPS